LDNLNDFTQAELGVGTDAVSVGRKLGVDELSFFIRVLLELGNTLVVPRLQQTEHGSLSLVDFLFLIDLQTLLNT